jgi:hypothetical protein
MLPASRLAYAVAAAPVLVLACTRAPDQLNDSLLPQVEASRYDQNVRRDLARVRAATTAFHDIAVAHAAGFPTAPPACLSATTGGMGQHYVDRRLLDNQLDVEKPEILLYAPTSAGKLKLVAVEYIVPLSTWQDTQPPRIFGQSLKRSEELKLWYLHVWAWEQNSAGLFADWNPAVKC